MLKHWHMNSFTKDITPKRKLCVASGQPRQQPSAADSRAAS